MPKQIASILKDIRALEAELEVELRRRQRQLRYTVRRSRAVFDQAVLRMHRMQREPLWRYLLTARPHFILTAPIIYGMLLPLLMLDAIVTFYQWTCFPIYRMARVPRREHFVYDRAQLRYLNLAERMNCFYCSYANGFASYLREIAARTEQYWCPIKHARRVQHRHERYGEFLDFGDARGYKRRLDTVRTRLRR